MEAEKEEIKRTKRGKTDKAEPADTGSSEAEPPAPKVRKKGSGGAREGAGKPVSTKDGNPREQVIASILPDTLHYLKILGAKTKKGRKARAPIFASSILDQWAEQKGTRDGKITGESKHGKSLPALFEARRVQVTCWVERPTAIKIYALGLERSLTRSAFAGLILDIWGAVQAKKPFEPGSAVAAKEAPLG